MVNNNANNYNNDNNDIDIPWGGLEWLVLVEEGKPKKLREKSSEKGQKPTINSTHVWHQIQDSNPGDSNGLVPVFGTKKCYFDLPSPNDNDHDYNHSSHASTNCNPLPFSRFCISFRWRRGWFSRFKPRYYTRYICTNSRFNLTLVNDYNLNQYPVR